MAGSHSPGADEPLHIFVSYAHADNVVSPDEGGPGLVSALVSHIDHVLTRKGPPKPHIWWDQRKIDKADVFPPILTEAIERASLLLVVMSRNWMDRPWCRRELELFAKRKDHQEHIVLVRADHVEWDDHPPQLKHITGYNFFSLDGWREAGDERLFFNRGKVEDKLFYDYVDQLGSVLWRRTKNILQRRDTKLPEDSGLSNVDPVVPDEAPRKDNGRTIFLAKPAKDTDAVYRRIAHDLDRDGFRIVPPVDQHIPTDSVESTLKFIDDALASAEASIHLVGAKRGLKVDDELDAIVPLQLTRAAKRIGETCADGSAFCRVVWAPKCSEEDCNFPGEGFREPMNVLKGVDAYREGDQLYGDVSSAFLTSLKQFLSLRPKVSRSVDPVPKPGSRIYVWHDSDDRAFARKVRGWLRRHDAETFFLVDDKDPKRQVLHNQYLLECDAVFLCWAEAPPTWASMSALSLRNWQHLGRKNPFAIRGLVLGPPPGESKCEDDLPSIPHQIDEYLDLSKDAELDLDKLEPLYARACPQQIQR